MPYNNEVVGLFGLPTQKGMEQVMVKRMGSATTDLKTHVSRELKTPMLLVSVASLAVLFYVLTKAMKD